MFNFCTYGPGLHRNRGEDNVVPKVIRKLTNCNFHTLTLLSIPLLAEISRIKFSLIPNSS